MDVAEYVRDCADEARERHYKGALLEAGEWYTKATYARLSKSLSDRSVRLACYLLSRGALCYRISGDVERCRNRCKQGILIVEEMIEENRKTVQEREEMDERDVSRNNVNIGGWHELIGDFRLVGDLEGVEEAYDMAEDWYTREETKDKPLVYHDGYGMSKLQTFYNSVADGLDLGWDSVDWDTEYTYLDWVKYRSENLPTGKSWSDGIDRHSTEYTYADWLEYKRDRLPGMIKELVERGEWDLSDD